MTDSGGFPSVRFRVGFRKYRSFGSRPELFATFFSMLRIAAALLSQ
jgi:hypothetical protein